MCVCDRMWLMIVCSASVVFECGLKAYCVGEIMLCVSRCVISCLFMIVSSILPIMGSSEIGR